MPRAILSFIVFALITEFSVGPAAGGDGPSTGGIRPDGHQPTTEHPRSKADRLPRKVVVGTVIYGPYGEYPGLEARLNELGGLVDQMVEQAAKKYPGRGLDLAILPETTASSTSGSAKDRAVPLHGKVEETFGALARKHKTYILVPFDMAEEGPAGRYASNAAVLFDRKGEVAGIYRKAHPVAYVNSDELEGGITPGAEYPVFDCDFGRLGVQICWDIQFPEGWDALAKKGAEIVAWPTASPATVLPASRAAAHRYYVVSSTWRDNATIYEPTGMVAAQVTPPERILVHQLDLSYAILGWSSFLRNGEALREKYRDKVGFHYSTREDMGLFWSNDPATTIGTMIRSIGGLDLDSQVEHNRQLYAPARPDGHSTGIRISPHRPGDLVEVSQANMGKAVTINSETGIGGVVLQRTSTRWQGPIQIRLRLRGLESLRISAGSLILSADGSAAGKTANRVSLLTPGQVEQPVTAHSPYWFEIRAIDAQGQPSRTVPLAGGHFAFDLPPALLDLNPAEVRLEWIDFHR